MYKFQGAQQYRHPDHVIRKSHKTERYSDTGTKVQILMNHFYPDQSFKIIYLQ